MDLRINGSYEVYLYVVLLQLSIDRLDLNRRLDRHDEKPLSAAINDYLLTTRIVALGLSWTSWLLAIYVGAEFGLASAALFLLLGLGTSVMVTVLIPPLLYADVIIHVVSWPVTAYLFHATLVALGL